MDTRDVLLAVVIVVLGVALVYFLDPTFGGLFRPNKYFTLPQMSTESFSDGGSLPGTTGAVPNVSGSAQAQQVMAGSYAVDNMAATSGMSPADSGFGAAEAPKNCYPKKQLKASELLPNDPNSKWAQVNPMGQGDIAGKNYLSAGALIGVNTIGQSLRNANYQLRSDPPNPQVKVSIWQQSTIEPDINRRSLEIG